MKSRPVAVCGYTSSANGFARTRSGAPSPPRSAASRSLYPDAEMFRSAWEDHRCVVAFWNQISSPSGASAAMSFAESWLRLRSATAMSVTAPVGTGVIC